MYTSMRCLQLGWLILGIILTARRAVVYGMPLELPGGSTLCRLNFRTIAGKDERSRVAFEVLYRDIGSIPGNSTECNLELQAEASNHKMPSRTERSFDHIQVRLIRENADLFKIFVDKKAQDWLEGNANSFVRIVCANRKFSCIQFLSAKKGASRVRRNLLSIDQLYTYEDHGVNVPLKALFLMLAGAVILVAAAGLCANCDKPKDDESVSEARPQLVSLHQRSSQSKLPPQEQQIHEEIVFESKDDVFIETAEKIDGHSTEANNHKPLTTIAHYEPPPTSVQREKPCSTEAPEPPSGTHHAPSSVTQRVPQSDIQHVPQSGRQHVPSSGTPHEPHVTKTEHAAQSNTQSSASPPEPEAGDRTSRASKAGSSKKKHGSEHEHEEHKGKFWKRTRSAKASSTSGTTKAGDRTSGSGPAAERTSDVVLKEEEHKNKRSKKESKEQKTKSGKTKGRTGSTDSEKEKNEINALHDDHVERPREATPTLERHTRGLPAPPGTSGPALPTRPVPQRQVSAPDGTEDDNYEVVVTRKTKSMERFKAAPVFTDDDYDVVETTIGKPRLPSVEEDSVDGRSNAAQRTSDIYEVVDDTNGVTDDLYSEVRQEEKDGKNEKTVKDEDVDLEDPYSRIKYQKQLEAKTSAEPYDNVEDLHFKKEEQTENSELYEDVEKRQESSDKNHKYSKVNKGEVMRLMIENETKTELGDRNRSQSDAAALQRSGNELPKRPNTIHVIQSTGGEVTQTEGEATSPPFDYTYAKVDLSKKTRRPHDTEEDSWDPDNPPPLPPAYISSRQIQIEMGRATDPENLYDEIATGAKQDRPPNMELLTTEDESKRLSSVSGDYELVEVPAMPIRMTADNYTEVVEREPRPKSGACRAGPVHVQVCNAPANISVTVTSSMEALEKTMDEDDGIPHYETVTTTKKRKEESRLSGGEWV